MTAVMRLCVKNKGGNLIKGRLGNDRSNALMREKQGRKPYKTAILAMVAEMRLSSGCSNALMHRKIKGYMRLKVKRNSSP